MAQIAIIPTTASQATSPSPPAGGDESHFSPHLENAIAEQKPAKEPQQSPATDSALELYNSSSEQMSIVTAHQEHEGEAVQQTATLQSATSAEETAGPLPQATALFHKIDKNEKESVNKEVGNPINDDSLQIAVLDSIDNDTENSTGMLLHQIQGESTQVPGETVQNSAQNISSSVTVQPTPDNHPQTSPVSTAIPTGMLGAGNKLVDISTGGTGGDLEKYGLKSSDTYVFRQLEVHNGVETIKLGSPTPTTQATEVRSQNETLLVRLQEIINNSSEAGRVSVTRAATQGPAFSSVSELSQPAVSSLSIISEEFPQTATQPVDQQPPSLRHNVQHQYFQAKVSADPTGENGGDTQTNSQDNSKNSDTAAQGTVPAQPNSSLAGVEQSGTFSQTAALVQENASRISSGTSRPILLSSGTIVQEENVVQQFMERFQIARRIAESKINIKLHPAELGELKIDLSVKEGSIKANVVAQSQQVQEIIERNIARLRSVLEDQGYNLDAVSVTTESDSVGDFDLFDRQLFSQHEQDSPKAHQAKKPPAGFDQEIMAKDEKTNSSGVNVRV